jgi:hypothetical protein
LGMKFPQRASPVDRKLGDLELMGRPIDPGFKNLASPQNVQFAGVIDLQQRHTVRQIAEAVERQLLERRKVMRRSCRGTPPAQCFDFKRPPRTRRIERRRPFPALERSGCFASTCTLVRADIPASSTSFKRIIPEGRCVLPFRNAQVLPSWPGASPTGPVHLALSSLSSHS